MHIKKIKFLIFWIIFTYICFSFSNISFLYSLDFEHENSIKLKIDWTPSLSEAEKKDFIKEKLQKLLNKRKNILLQDKIKEDNIKKLKERIRQRIKYRIILNNKNQEKLDFTTTIDIKKYPNNLDISNKLIYKNIQEKSLSCELSATSDILSYFENKNISEDSIIDMVEKSYYNKPYKIVNNKKIWWNPNAWYVWYIDKIPSWEKATQKLMTWYWVLEQPINKIYNKYNYSTQIITQNDYNLTYNQANHLTEILKSINNWKMVQLWWDYCTIPEFEDTKNKNYCSDISENRKLIWYYEENWKLSEHKWLIWEHAFYLLWYKWWINKPTHIIVWDTKTWKHTFPTKEWIRKWNMMDNRSIIVNKN